MPFATIRDVTLHYDHHVKNPGGRTLVFINSLGTDFRIWDDVISGLPKDVNVLLYDKRGHGLSDLGSKVDVEGHIDDLFALMGHLGISSAVFCGLSVGGLITQGVFARNPDLCEGMILCDTGHKIGNVEMWNDRIAQLDKGGLESMAEAILERWFSEDFRSNRKEELNGYRNMLVRTPVAGYRGTSEGIRDADFTAETARIDVPVLCVVGTEDGATPPALVQEMARLIPNADYQEIDGVGHLPCVENPAKVIELVTGFLTRL